MKNLLNKLLFTFKYRMSLMHKLLFSYIVLIIVPLMTLTFFSYAHVSGTLVKQFQLSSNTSLQQTSTYLARILRDLTSETEQFAYNHMLTDIYDKSPDNSLVEQYEDYMNTFNIADGIFVSDVLYSVEIYTNGKYTLAQSNGKNGIYLIDIESNFGKELNQKLSKFRGDLLWLDPRDITPIFSDEETSVITGARYIKSSRTAANIGILTVNIKQPMLQSIVSRSSSVSDSVSLILDNMGTILVISDDELYQSYGISSDFILNNIADGETSFDIGKNTFLINSAPIEDSNWTLVSITPYKNILQPSIETRNHSSNAPYWVNQFTC